MKSLYFLGLNKRKEARGPSCRVCVNKMLLEIKKYPDPILKQKCEEVKKITPDIQKLILNMIETMHKNKGIGLAGVQVGILKRIIVCDVGKGPLALINPRITSREGEAISEEGCLSVPETFINVKRAERITVEGLDERGEKRVIKTKGMLSYCVQHEVDHLDGILILDKQKF